VRQWDLLFTEPDGRLASKIKLGRQWVFKAIPRKANGERDWNVVPEGRYFVEWRESGTRLRLPAGRTVAQALEARRIKKAETQTEGAEV
jgi:hypothetical protein